MATRGRTNIRAKTAAKKAAAPIKTTPTAKQKASGGISKSGVLSAGLNAGAQLLGLGGGTSKGNRRPGYHMDKNGNWVKNRKSAKNLLKRAYERRAKRQIQMGNLGQARRSLRKKQTVV